MIRFFIYFLLLLISVWIGVQIHKDPGYVLINYQNWSLETTLWFALLALLVMFLLLYFLLRLFRGTSNLSNRFRNWSDQRRSRKANRLTNRGLCQLAEGDWKPAEKNLLRGAADSETPLINYLAAANAAQQQGHYEDRDTYLRDAHNTTPLAEIAIGLTQAQLQFGAKQWELALATLRHLNQLAPNHNYILRLLKKVYLKLGDWNSLRELLPELRKRKILKPKELEQLEHKIYVELLTAATHSDDPNWVTQVWESVPAYLRYDSALLDVYTEFLLKHKQDSKAETLLRDALKKNWDAKLIARYGICHGADPQKQLALAESWLKNHNNDPDLLLCLGRLCAHNQLWGKARDYLQSSIQIEPRSQAYQELGQLLEQLGETGAALDCYRQGLLISTPTPNIPPNHQVGYKYIF